MSFSTRFDLIFMVLYRSIVTVSYRPNSCCITSLACDARWKHKIEVKVRVGLISDNDSDDALIAHYLKG